MALNKELVLANGITLNYHRIVSINNITNCESIIEVASYINSDKREEEKEALKNQKPMSVFIKPTYISKEYTSDLDIVSAYAYLKTLDDFYMAKNC
nr:MAG TPA: hypothetical protein [Caudoviricetes sp.]